MSKSFYKKIKIPIYYKNLHICSYTKSSIAQKALNKRGVDIILLEDDLNAGALSIMNFTDPQFGGVIIFVAEEIGYDFIVHEVDHIVHALLQSIGMKRTKASEEAYSYLQGHIVKEIINIIKSKGIKIK